MNSIITEQIPKQGFEIVRDLIGAILFVEINNQMKLLEECDVDVYVGRTTPFQQSEQKMINVLLDSAGYDSSNQFSQHGDTKFYIDYYTTGKAHLSVNGGTVSTLDRDSFTGKIRYILQNHKYNTLSLPKKLGCIMNTDVLGFENFDTANAQDSSFVTMSRTTFTVRINEEQSVWESTEINTIFTDVRLNQSDNGYKYEKINN